MNQYGSYRKLLENAIEACSAAIEIYNKPKLAYRDEVFVILLINAWELVLKAFLSKKKQKLFYPKKKGVPYRTLSLSDILKHCEALFPKELSFKSSVENLNLLVDYRDNAIHFYNEPGFSVLIYGLAQTAIVNFNDILKFCFNRTLAKEINIVLLPLAPNAPLDPIHFLSLQVGGASKSKIVRNFTDKLKLLTQDLEKSGNDTGKLLSTFTVSFQSVKKVSSADIVVGIDSSKTDQSILIKEKIDPNQSYPFLEGDLVTSPRNKGKDIKIGKHDLTSRTFRAIVHKYNLKTEPKYFWRDSSGRVSRWSSDIIPFLKRLKEEDVDLALKEYNVQQKNNLKINKK